MTAPTRQIVSITNVAARQILEAALTAPEASDIRYSIAVVDAAGQLVAFSRMNGAAVQSAQVAQDKAYTAAGFGISTGQWPGMVADDAPRALGVAGIDRLVPFGGGLPITIDGTAVGGSVSQEDTGARTPRSPKQDSPHSPSQTDCSPHHTTTRKGKPMIKTVQYTAEALSTGGGRDGHVRTTDGRLDLDLAISTGMGGSGDGANPELLFAAGYAACYHSALHAAARTQKVTLTDSSVGSRVHVGPNGDGGFELAVELEVVIPSLPHDQAQALADAAHLICPYSNATRGNITVTITVSDD